MWTYSSLGRGRHVYCIELKILCCPIYCFFFFFWNFTFAKVEHCQITENCGISWEDSVMVEPI